MRINGPLPILPRLRGRKVVLISYVRPTLKQSLAVLQHTLFEIKKTRFPTLWIGWDDGMMG